MISRTMDQSDLELSFDAGPHVEDTVQIVTVKQHECAYCTYVTRDKSNLNKHIRRRHSSGGPSPGPSTSSAPTPGPSTSSAPTPGPSTSSAPTPGPSTSSAPTPGPSTSSAPTPGPSTSSGSGICDQCGKTFRSQFGVTLHIKNKHLQEFKYECTLCDKKFNQKRPYRYHCGKHLQVSVDKCHHCQTEFNSPGSLNRHLVVCRGGPGTSKFKCDKCASSFPHKYRLSDHKKGKHGPKRYGCDKCGKYYAWRSSLKEHKAVCDNKTS